MIRSTLLGGLLLAAGCANIHTVDPGQVYRSAQLDGEELEELVDRYGIRTIVNLRGTRPGREWYDTEREVARRRGLAMIDVNMKASRIPRRDDLVALLDAFRGAARPILIHCKAGADRTGEAAAIYALEYLGLPLEEATAMLHWRYGHFETFTGAKDYFVEEVYRGDRWAREEYDPETQDYEYYQRGR